MSRKKLMVISFAAIATLSTFSYAEANKVRAETTSKYSPIVQGLVNKFNLNTNDVDNVISDVRDARQEERLKTIEERLTQLVSENKLTTEQKTKLLAKIKEWQNTKDTWGTLSHDERHEKVAQHREEMLKWAQDNGIDSKYLMGLGERQFLRGYSKGYRMGAAAN